MSGLVRCNYCGYKGDNEQITGCQYTVDMHCGACHNQFEKNGIKIEEST